MHYKTVFLAITLAMLLSGSLFITTGSSNKLEAFRERNVRKKPSGARRFPPTVKWPDVAPQERLFKRVKFNKQLTRPDLTSLPINVTVRVILINIRELVEKNELVETTVRIQIGWRDKRLMWSKEDYGGLPEILLPASSLWIPDLAIMNAVDDVYKVVRDYRFEMKVQNNGQLWWHPTGVVKTFCQIHLCYFPFDRQMCSIIIESPTLDTRFLDLHLRSGSNPVDLRMYVESETWVLVKTFGTSQNVKVGTNTYFSRLEFWFIIDRARLYHNINFILPCFILSVIQTVFLFLPVAHPQRVGSTTVTMLSVMVFQSMVVAQLPKTSESVPLMTIYIDLVILVSATSVCSSVFTALCQFKIEQKLPLPKWLQALFSLNRSMLKTFVQRQECFPSVEPCYDYYNTENHAKQVTRHQNKLEEKNKRQNCQVARNTNARAVTINELHNMRQQALRELHSAKRRQTTKQPQSHVLKRHRPPEREPGASQGQTANKNKDNTKTDDVKTWLEILSFVDRFINITCALAISLGPIIMFGVIPSVITYHDYPDEIGYNFTLVEMKQQRGPAKK